MEARGLQQGDRIIVQKVAHPETGDVIVVEHEGRVLVGEWGIRSLNFRPPAGLALDPQFQPLPDRDLAVIGKAVSLVRDL